MILKFNLRGYNSQKFPAIRKKVCSCWIIEIKYWYSISERLILKQSESTGYCILSEFSDSISQDPILKISWGYSPQTPHINKMKSAH